MSYIAISDGICVKVIDGIIEIMPIKKIPKDFQDIGNLMISSMDERHKSAQEIIDEIESKGG